MPPTSTRDRPKRAIDSFGEATKPQLDGSELSQRSGWWWFLVMPGKVILWVEYMFPERISGVFGTARRRNVPLIQILYSLFFYIVVIGLALFLFSAKNDHG